MTARFRSLVSISRYTRDTKDYIYQIFTYQREGRCPRAVSGNSGNSGISGKTCPRVKSLLPKSVPFLPIKGAAKKCALDSTAMCAGMYLS
jgi:hypothetical protein